MRPVQPVFIVGAPRSGTTLLSVLLDRHSGLAMTPETAFYEEMAPRLAGQTAEVARDLLGAWPRLADLALQPDAVLAGPEARPPGAVFAALLERFRLAAGKARVGEKTPQHLRHVPAILSDFPDAAVLCMMRDGREMALSLAAMPWWSGDLADAARLWLEAEALCTEFEAAYPAHFHLVRYEALASDPQATLEAILPTISLAFEPQQLDPGLGSGVVLARSADWKGEALQSVEPERAYARGRNAGRAEWAFLTRVLAPTLRRRGYPVD